MSQRLRAEIHRWPPKTRAGEIAKWAATLVLCCTMPLPQIAILAEFGLPYVYPASVEKAADRIPAEIPAEEYAKREDFRNVTTFTIDPKDAKDFDDALSIRKLKDNLWEVGVHIADVTHYVTEGSIIDKEAEKRATSVYLVDRTIPMLPERLCNFICSLRPDEEKLAYSAIFEMTDKGEVKNSRIVHTVIKSDRRFTYEEAQQIIETKEGDFKEEILKLDSLAKILREKRFTAGAINSGRQRILRKKIGCDSGMRCCFKYKGLNICSALCI